MWFARTVMNVKRQRADENKGMYQKRSHVVLYTEDRTRPGGYGGVRGMKRRAILDDCHSGG